MRRLTNQVNALVDASLADNTRNSYDGAFGRFTDWCAIHRKSSCPAKPDTVAEYLADLAAAGRRGSTLKVYAAAIAHHHQQAGTANPVDDYTVRAVLRGAMRRRGAGCQKLPVSSEDLAYILKHVPSTLKGVRDRAMLTLAFSAALRRSELVAIRYEDLSFTPNGLIISIHRSKTDQDGTGTVVGVPYGRKLRAVEALKSWLAAAELTRGPLFRPVHGNRALPRPLAPLQLSRVLKGYLSLAKFDANLYGAHSLRAGFITDAAEFGVSLDRIMDHSRHVNEHNVRKYVRRANVFRDHPGEGFL